MTYQRFSGALLVSVAVISVMTSSPTDQDLHDRGERRVQDGDVQAHREADHEDEHGQVADLLTRRPRDLLQFGPRFIEEAAKSTHVGGSSFGYGRSDRCAEC